MDRYKKTSLKFDKNLGYGRNLRAVKINTSRAVARNSRFSMQRCLDDEVENSENQPKSKIAILGKLKAPVTRVEMLQKWKEEKQIKRQQELKNKKPTFKIGLSLPKSFPGSTTGNKTDSKILSMKDSRMISFNVNSSSKLKKETCLKPLSTTKFQALPLSNMKLPKNKEPQVQSFNYRPPVTQFSNSKVQKESHLQVPNKPKSGLQKPLFVSSKQIKNEEVCQSPMKSQFVPNKPFIAKSKMQPLSALPKIKITESKILKKPEQGQPSMSRRIPNGIPDPKSNPVQNSGRIIKGPSKIAFQAKPTGIPNKSGIKPKQERKATIKTEESSNPNIAFECEISHIEPAVEKKSFAPKDFVFNPIANFSFSFLEEGPLAIYSKLKAGEERTSTPKRKELKEIQAKEAEKCLAEGGFKTEQVSNIPEIQDTANSSYNQTTSCLPQSKLSEEEESIVVVATPSEAVEHVLENDPPFVVSKESDVKTSFKACEISCDAIKNSPEDKSIEENSKPENSVTNIPEALSVIKEIQIPSFVPTSVSPKEQIENLMDVFYSPEISEPQTFQENCTNEILDSLESKVALENPITQESVDVFEEEKNVFEENETLSMAVTSSDPVKHIKATLNEGDAGIISRRRSSTRSNNISVRGNRRSEMPLLESISESIESSPLKESPPKPLSKKKSALAKDFTPRRSMRVANRSELDKTENLFNVRPSLHGMPTDEAGCSTTCNTSNITYDFDKLHLESTKEQPAIPKHRMSTRKGNKVSLLYTPPQRGRASTIRKSIKGDLMSFSPDV